MTESIFSFGTLRDPEVQTGLFGREVPSTPDALHGHVVGTITIEDPEVVRLSGAAVHPALQATGRADDVVEGAVLDVTADELAAADAYERHAFHRIPVVLASGRAAWAYLPTPR